MVCVGEHLEDRERGKTNEVVSKQLKAIAGECLQTRSALSWGQVVSVLFRLVRMFQPPLVSDAQLKRLAF